MSERRNVWLMPIPNAMSEEASDELLLVEVQELTLTADKAESPPSSLAPLALAGEAANRAAAHNLFEEYRERLAASTLRRQRADLALFSRYVQEAGVALEVERLWQEPPAWQGVTWGLVKGFVRWLLQAGYATGSINVRLATLKSYVRLAAQAGAISPTELGLILTVKGYSQKQGRNLDAQRERSRLGAKKAMPTRLSETDAAALKQQPDTPQGRRDTLLMCLLLDHGLRVGEVAELEVQSFHLAVGRMTFYRRKVDETQTHRLTPDTVRAAQAYLCQDALSSGPLLRGSRKNGELAGHMSVRALRLRVQTLGEQMGLVGLSPHDCRHYWATYWAPRVSLKQLQKAGGWASPAMPLHYAQAAEIANEGMT